MSAAGTAVTTIPERLPELSRFPFQVGRPGTGSSFNSSNTGQNSFPILPLIIARKSLLNHEGKQPFPGRRQLAKPCLVDKYFRGLRAKEWLGGRDSNPDTQIQSLQSYH